jgi:hypothetical protein
MQSVTEYIVYILEYINCFDRISIHDPSLSPNSIHYFHNVMTLPPCLPINSRDSSCLSMYPGST